MTKSLAILLALGLSLVCVGCASPERAPIDNVFRDFN